MGLPSIACGRPPTAADASHLNMALPDAVLLSRLGIEISPPGIAFSERQTGSVTRITEISMLACRMEDVAHD
jgi:hypothetical protein